MAHDWTLAFKGVEEIPGTDTGETRLGSPGWRVKFQVARPRASYDVAIFVDAGCPKEDIVRQAMHRFHLQMSELAEDTAGWRLP